MSCDTLSGSCFWPVRCPSEKPWLVLYHNNNIIIMLSSYIAPFQLSLLMALYSMQLLSLVQTCSFLDRLNSLGSIQLLQTSRRIGTDQTQAFTVLLGTNSLLGRESAHVGKVDCPGPHCQGKRQRRTRKLPIMRPARCHCATTPHK